MQASVDAINALEPELEKLSDEELVARTPWLQERIQMVKLSMIFS